MPAPRTGRAAPVRFVLVRPRVPENVGAAARVLRNFGHADWALVDPEGLDREVVLRLAVGAEDLAESVPVHRTLDAAVADCAWVVGTESRRVGGRTPLDPDALAADWHAGSPGGRTALVV
ncbi:MAG TPA: TrmH family RNA methyltransferase, partial [Thermoanaerobaculia bacterium]|nr:TrmH family RNA methyltransferase [Thermoanaerobaculia bacterium]